MLIHLNFSNVPIMDNIIEPNETFDFSKLSLSLPTGIQGGAYFTKIHYLNKPLYIQTTKSLTKQGIVKTGKKLHCDLMFDNNSENLIRWLERLETTCQKLIYEKSESWFESALDLNDIETAFNSTIRVYKSGKYYLVRTNIKNNNVSTIPIIKIYDENENILSIEDVTCDSNIISIIEIQGIKFTSHNFQIEMELKQIMVINNEPIFENCMIRTSNKKVEISNIKDLEKEIIHEINEKNNNSLKEIEKTMILENIDLNKDLVNDINNNISSNNENNDNNHLVVNKDLEESQEILTFENEKIKDNLDLDIEELNELEIDKELKEMELSIPLENNLDTITLKKPNEVYYKIYKEARNKAKDAKKLAIIAYLEAKNIKKTYMLDELDYSDNDFDNEIEEVSESELEGL